MNQSESTPITVDVLQRFVDQGYLSGKQRDQLASSTRGGLRSMIDNGLVPERAFAEILSAAYQAPQITRQQLPTLALPGTQGLSGFLIQHEALPISLLNGVLSLAMSDPSDEFTLQVLGSKLKCLVEPHVALRSELLEALARVYPNGRSADAKTGKVDLADDLDLPDDLNSDSVLVRDLHRLIQRAVSSNASDIHFEPVESNLRVRFRIHGLLRDIDRFSGQQADQVVARLKLMSKLDVTERRQAQNGRFKFPADGRMIDLRVSTLPLHDGESIVLRLLEFGLSQLSLQELGFSQDIADSMQQAISSQQGLVLITGPTGSGKSTTLYALLNQLNRPELKLISIEDPVELNIAGINQIQVDEDHGISFASALKTVLRQDPDVIMVGEIRDAETAQLAAQAALTGHLVLATLHTPSAASAITRLINLGLPEYLVSSTVKAVLAQRLLRRVCRDCQRADSSEACSNCAGLKYSGRTTIAEYLPPSALVGQVSEQVGQVSEQSMATKLLNGISLHDDAARLIASGETDQAEVFRVLGFHAQPSTQPNELV
ncbi:MAG: type II/IV secretion system protein [Arenicella sp.]|nr:type II/IV secretion system protein [Arenicella sp.]